MKNMLCVGLLPEEIRGVKAKAAKGPDSYVTWGAVQQASVAWTEL